MNFASVIWVGILGYVLHDLLMLKRSVLDDARLAVDIEWSLGAGTVIQKDKCHIHRLA